MIRCISFSSEHKKIPNQLLLSSETTNRNRSTYNQDKSYNEYSFDVYCTYAWFETNEVNTSTLPNNKIPIAVMDYKPSYSKRTVFVFKDPIWDFIEETRTPEIQQWIEQNIEHINEIFISFAQSNGASF